MTAAPEPVTSARAGAADRSTAAQGAAGPVAAPLKRRSTEPGAAAEGAAPEEEGKKKGGKKKKLLIVAVVLVLLVGVYMVKFRSHEVVYKPGQPVPPGKVTSLGTLTVNTSDGHVVQVGIDLQLTEPAQTKTVSADQPQLRNAAILDLGQQTYPGLLAPSGRTALQQQLLASFQQILGTVDGAAPQVSAVYFTSFILQ